MEPTQVIQKTSEQNARKERQQDTTENTCRLHTEHCTHILEILHVPYIVTTKQLQHYIPFKQCFIQVYIPANTLYIDDDDDNKMGVA